MLIELFPYVVSLRPAFSISIFLMFLSFLLLVYIRPPIWFIAIDATLFCHYIYSRSFVHLLIPRQCPRTPFALGFLDDVSKQAERRRQKGAWDGSDNGRGRMDTWQGSRQALGGRVSEWKLSEGEEHGPPALRIPRASRGSICHAQGHFSRCLEDVCQPALLYIRHDYSFESRS